jgi:two-component sensor histidine kinase
MNLSHLPFFKAHVAGAEDQLLIGDPNPGPISGKKRFTFSRVLRNPDGSIKAVYSAAIQTDNFDSLYEEASRRRGASTGLFRHGGGILAEHHADTSSDASFPSADLLKEVEDRMVNSFDFSGTDVVAAGPEPRLTSWRRSEEYPAIYAMTSDPLSDVLSSWRNRTIVTSVLVALSNLILWGFAVAAIRAWEAQQQQAVHDLAVREIHHRLKNSLQMLSSLIRLRSSRYDDPTTREAVAEITSDLQAVAEVHTVLQNSPSEKTIELRTLLQGICSHFRRLSHSDITFTPGQPVSVSSNYATPLSIVINELLTNAVKHGDGRIEVTYAVHEQNLIVDVRNAVVSGPRNAETGTTTGFGLRAISAVIDGLGGTLARDVTEEGRATARVTVPLSALVAR